MLDYDEPLFRPPSEAYNLILQVTLGCSHNTCTFCTMYKGKKFRAKTWPEISALIDNAAHQYPQTRRIFLADGNALVLPADVLNETICSLYAAFPHLERVTCYAGPKDILAKNPDELRTFKENGLSLIYLGIESGSERILQAVKKGVAPEEMIAAGQKARRSGLALSATIISGLGGKKHWEEHAIETARVVSAINPEYLASLTLFMRQGAPMLKQIEKGELEMLTPWETLQESRLLIENLDLTNCTYRSNHVSNYFDLACVLNEEKVRILNKIDRYLADPRLKALPAEFMSDNF